MPTLPAVSTIAQTISLSLSPIFMLAGIGALLNVLAGRLSRVIDRARVLQQLHRDAGTAEVRAHLAWEMRLLNRRMTVVNAALFLAVSSAVATCTVVVLLFVASLGHFHIGQYVAFTFILAMLLLIASLVGFMVEVRLSLRANRVRFTVEDGR